MEQANEYLETIREKRDLNILNWVHQIDSRLEFIGGFTQSEVGFVGLVLDKGEKRVIKASYNDHLKWRRGCKRESAALKVAEEVEGITHLTKDYGYTEVDNQQMYAILKEYAEGRFLEEGERIEYFYLQKYIQNTVKELHNLGVYNLDIKKRDVVISEDGLWAKIIDLDTAISPEDKLFAFLHRKRKIEDKQKVESLFV